MNFPLTIIATITQDDIQHGRQQDCRNCPIARAITRELSAGYHAAVDGWSASIRADAYERVALAFADLGSDGERFVRAFDNDDHVEPFTLTITFNEAP